MSLGKKGLRQSHAKKDFKIFGTLLYLLALLIIHLLASRLEAAKIAE